MTVRDAATNEIIVEGQECFFVENEGVYIEEEAKMIEYLVAQGWTEKEIEEARESDYDDDGESLGSESIYFTTYAE